MTGVRFGTSLTYLAAYVAAFLLGRLVIIPGSGLAMFWPAAGVAALWMLRGRTRDQVTLDALLLFLTTAVVNLLFQAEPLPTALWAVANLVQGYAVRQVAAWFERRPVSSELLPGVRTARQLLTVGCGAVLGALLSAPVSYVASVVRTDIGPWSGEAWVTWTVRNACGALVVTVAVLAIRGSVDEQRSRHSPLREALAGERRPYVLTELAAAVLVTLTSITLVFSSGQGLPIGFVMLASSAWIGFRFTPVVAGVHTLVFGSLAVLSSLEGWGPFGDIADLSTRAIIVQTFVAVTAVITLMLSLGVAERGRLLERLRISESHAHGRAEMLDAVKDALTDGLAVIDSRGNVLIRNPAAHLLAGNRDDGEEGSGSVEDDPAEHGFYAPDGSALSYEDHPHVRALKGEVVRPTDYLRVDPETGATSMLSINAVPLRLPDEDDPLAVLLIHDATRERAQTRELQAFAGVVAHDLANPLASLMNWAEILDDQLDELAEDASAARGSLVKIYRSADQMQQLIQDLLLLTRTSSSELEMVAVSLDGLVELAARETVDQSTGIEPRIEHGPLGNVCADLTLVRQVLTNLIGNAVKYVAPGVQPVVRISASRVGEMVQVQVVDNGIGIPDSDRSRVFDSWFRSQGSRRLYPGTGLGLSITARAVERHGGTITARSRTDASGTVFTFTLPVDPEPLLRMAPPLEDDPQREGRTTSADPPPRRTGSDTAVS